MSTSPSANYGCRHSRPKIENLYGGNCWPYLREIPLGMQRTLHKEVVTFPLRLEGSRATTNRPAGGLPPEYVILEDSHLNLRR